MTRTRRESVVGDDFSNIASLAYRERAFPPPPPRSSPKLSRNPDISLVSNRIARFTRRTSCRSSAANGIPRCCFRGIDRSGAVQSPSKSRMRNRRLNLPSFPFKTLRHRVIHAMLASRERTFPPFDFESTCENFRARRECLPGHYSADFGIYIDRD